MVIVVKKEDGTDEKYQLTDGELEGKIQSVVIKMSKGEREFLDELPLYVGTFGGHDSSQMDKEEFREWVEDQNLVDSMEEE